MSSYTSSCPFAKPVEAMADPFVISGARVAAPPQRRHSRAATTLRERQQEEEEELATVVVFSANVLDAGAQPKEDKTQELRYRSADELYGQLERLHLLRRISAEQAIKAARIAAQKKEAPTTADAKPRPAHRKQVSFAPNTKGFEESPLPYDIFQSMADYPLFSKRREYPVLPAWEAVPTGPEPTSPKSILKSHSLEPCHRRHDVIGSFSRKKHTDEDNNTVSTVDELDTSEAFSPSTTGKLSRRISKRSWIRKLFRRSKEARLP